MRSQQTCVKQCNIIRESSEYCHFPPQWFGWHPYPNQLAELSNHGVSCSFALPKQDLPLCCCHSGACVVLHGGSCEGRVRKACHHAYPAAMFKSPTWTDMGHQNGTSRLCCETIWDDKAYLFVVAPNLPVNHSSDKWFWIRKNMPSIKTNDAFNHYIWNILFSFH